MEGSYWIKFRENELAHVRTLGDLLDAIDARIPGQDVKDCTTQQAFYRIRAALLTERDMDPSTICTDSALDVLIPRNGRRHTVKRIELHVGVPLDVLSVKRWVGVLLTLLACGSLACFIWSSQLAIIGLGVFTALFGLASSTKKEFNVRTVGALAERMSQRAYKLMRRNDGTVNRNEIRAKLKALFQDELGLDKRDLRDDILIMP